MGFATIFGSLAFGFIFVSMVVFATVVQHNMAEAATEDHGRAENEQRVRSSSISITSATYDPLGTAQWIDNLYADFANGTTANTEVTREGSITLTTQPYVNGTYTSSAIDTGFSTTEYTALSWSSVEPLSTSITFQLRSANDTAALAAASFIGPDGTATTYYTISGSSTNETHNDSRYIQYRAYLGTNDDTQTPQLTSVTIDLVRPVGTTTIDVQNTGSEKLLPGETDVYLAGQRIARTDAQRTLTLQDSAEQALWNPGETITITVPRAITTPNTLTVANGPVTATGIV